MRTMKILKWTLALFLILGTGLAGAVWWKFDQVLNKVIVQKEPELGKNNEENAKDYHREPISFVILGKDSRGNLGLLNTDVIIVAVLNPMNRHVTMMSIPRDTGVQIPGYKGWYKINSVFARGEESQSTGETGISLVKKTIQGALNIPVQHYVTIDFEGFERMIDKLGGVSIEVDKSMKYDDPADGTHIDLRAGKQVLTGQQALGYVRHRKDNRGPKYYSTDFDRGRRQQILIKAIVDKLKSFSGISSFFGILDVAGDHIRTDFSKDEMKGIFMDYKSVGSENITSIQSSGFWDPVSTHTIIPRENVVKIQEAFRQEMGLDTEKVVSTFREQPAKVVMPVKKRAAQEEEALKVQIEEKKNEQVNMEKAHPVGTPTPASPKSTIPVLQSPLIKEQKRMP